jgi:4-hydroxy-4-methyl-2-oxoglutarate aldolase
MTAGPMVRRLRRLDTCAVSDARDQLGLPDATVTGIGNLTGVTTVAGRVVTVQLGPPQPTPSTQHLGTAAIEASGNHDVIVIDHQARTDCAAWGGNLSRGASARHIAGTLVHGAVRDVDEARTLGYPVYATASTPRTARGRTHEQSWNTTITFAGITVNPGDYVIADSTGIVFIRAGDISVVLAAAEHIVTAERAIAAAIDAGAPIGTAMGAAYERMSTTP